MQNKNLIFPLEQIASMGGQYIHSNWLYFANTIQGYDSEIQKLTDILRNIIIDYVEEEVDFYREAQQAYISEVSINSLQKLTNEQEILDHFRITYKNQLSNKKTNFGKLDYIKEEIKSLGNYHWSKESENIIFKSKSKQGKSLEQARMDMKEVLKGIEDYINFVSKNTNLSFLTDSRYSSKNKKNIPKSLDHLSSNVNIKNIKKRIKIIENNILTKKELKGEDINKVHEIMQELHIHAWSGLLAEKFQKDLIDKELSELLVKIGDKKINFDDVATRFMDVSIIDIAMGEVETTHGDTIIGLSQKFTNKDLIKGKNYKNYDIFHSLENYANSKIGKTADQQVEALQSVKPIFMYIRNNLIALESFSLDRRNASLFDREAFYKVEEELALLRNFLRFFNGMMEMLEDGTFNIFNPDSKGKFENTRIYTAFLNFRQEIYWTLDFVKPILESLKTTGKITGPGFYAYAKRKTLPNVKSASNLWNAKRKRLRELKKLDEKVTYSNLQTGSVSTLIKNVSEEAGGLLIDSLVYTLDPGAFFKGR